MDAGRRKRRGSVTLLLILAVLLLIATVGGAIVLWKAVSDRMDEVQVAGIPTASTTDAAFAVEWESKLDAPAIEMAFYPGRRYEFLALIAGDDIVHLDAHGKVLGQFEAPSRSSRIVTDPDGRFRHVLIVSSKKKWTGAIDYLETIDNFLQAVDTKGAEVWKMRFDPKQTSGFEPLIVDLEGNASPSIVLSAGNRIYGIDAGGVKRWEAAFWHHPGSLAAAHLDSDGRLELLAAQAPRKEIVRLDRQGQLVGPWGPGDGPSRLRLERLEPSLGAYGISFRQVLGSGRVGVQHSLTFFAGNGTVLNEVALPSDSFPLSFTPIAAMDVDGSGRLRWVVPLGNGSIRVYSPRGDGIATYNLGAIPKAVFVLPKANAPDLLVVAASRKLIALRPLASRMTAVP